MNKLLKLGCYGIEVSVADGGGIIRSEFDFISSDDDFFNGSVNALLSMILGHACAGVDVTSPAYIQGVETTVQDISNRL